MLMVVGLSLAAVLYVVITVGTSSKEPNWLLVTLIPVGLLGLAGLYLYFWIVVLELFIKMGPLYYVDGNLYGTQASNIPPPPVPMHAVPMIYGGQNTFFQNTNDLSPNSNMGPQSMIYQPTQPVIYTQPQPHSYIQTSQQQQIYFQQIHQQQQQLQQQQKSQFSMQ